MVVGLVSAAGILIRYCSWAIVIRYRLNRYFFIYEVGTVIGVDIWTEVCENRKILRARSLFCVYIWREWYLGNISFFYFFRFYRENECKLDKVLVCSRSFER